MGIKDEQIQDIISPLPEEKYQQIRFGDIYPTDIAPTITKDELKLARWGFDGFTKRGVLINARAETVLEKNIFRSRFIQNRCVIPASGFYEWDKAKKRYYFENAESEVLLLCGFLAQDRFIILTKAATEPVKYYHDRIPVMCSLENYREYLTNLSFAADYILTKSRIKLCVAS